MDCVDLSPVILVSSGLGEGWAASALWTWEEPKEQGACPGFGPFLMLGKDKKGISGKESPMSSPGAVTVVWAMDPGAMRELLLPWSPVSHLGRESAAVLRTGCLQAWV